MSDFVIYSYNGAGRSIRYLSQFLGGAQILDRDQDVPEGKAVINYGASYVPHNVHREWFNPPGLIRRTADKLLTFQYLHAASVPHVDITQDTRAVSMWLEEGNRVYARKTAAGSQGRGITVLSSSEGHIPSAAFYSRDLKHDDEWRIHVVRGKLVGRGLKYQKELNANPDIRNMDNGWAFRLSPPSVAEVDRVGVAAVKALGMDFGAADIGYCRATNKAYVFEVNSAPTMAEITAERYAHAFMEAIR